MPRSAAGDDRQLVLGEAPGQGDGGLIVRVLGRRSRGTKDGDARPDLRESFKGIHKFGHDPKNAPGILLDEAAGRVVVHGRSINRPGERRNKRHSVTGLKPIPNSAPDFLTPRDPLFEHRPVQNGVYSGLRPRGHEIMQWPQSRNLRMSSSGFNLEFRKKFLSSEPARVRSVPRWPAQAAPDFGQPGRRACFVRRRARSNPNCNSANETTLKKMSASLSWIQLANFGGTCFRSSTDSKSVVDKETHLNGK